MSKPTVSYDEDADVLYVEFSDGDIAKSQNLDDLRVIDYAADGSVAGIEFISASEGVDLSGIPFRPTVEAAIGDAGFRVKSLT